MAAYLSNDEYKLRTVIPGEYVDAVEVVAPGWTQAQLEQTSRWIDSRLRKRYDVPFDSAPEAVKSWTARITTLKSWMRRGVDPGDPQFDEIRADAAAAQKEVQEAADSTVGLFDLPLRDSERASGATFGGPRSYSEASPYVWADVQRGRASGEDRSGGGT